MPGRKKWACSDINKLLDMDDFVKGEDVIFVASGITDSSLLKGVVMTNTGAVTHSVIIRGKTGTIRFIEAIHSFEKKPQWKKIAETL